MPIPLGIGTAILGGVQAIGGIAMAMGLGERPKYSMTPEMRQSAGRANYMAGMGFLPEERAAAMQGAATQQAGAFRRAQDMGGGNLARSMGASMGSQNLDFQNRLAAQDASLRRQNIRYSDSFSQEAQRIADRNIAMEDRYRMATEQAIGGAIQSGLKNMAGFGNLQAYLGSGGAGGLKGIDMSPFQGMKSTPDGGYTSNVDNQMGTDYNLGFNSNNLMEMPGMGGMGGVYSPQQVMVPQQVMMPQQVMGNYTEGLNLGSEIGLPQNQMYNYMGGVNTSGLYNYFLPSNPY
jgi:hypothetical protein